MSARQMCQRHLDNKDENSDCETSKASAADAMRGLPLTTSSDVIGADAEDDEFAAGNVRLQQHVTPHTSVSTTGIDMDTFKELQSSQRFLLPRQSAVIGAEDLNEGMGCCGWILTTLSYVIVVLTFPFSFCICLKVVQEYERAVIFRLGRLIGGGARGPGIFFVLPCIESYTKVDLRTVSFEVPPQEVLTKDSVTVSVDAVVYYRVSNATISVANVENAHHSTRSLAQTTLRNVLGTKSLSEILIERDLISSAMQHILDDATEQQWGIKVERVEIKDVRLPVQLQRAMATEAEATREARAKVIAAEGEQRAARALRDAAEVISESPAALQLRYLQTLNSISSEKNSTIIFPFPIDFLKQFMGKSDSNNNGSTTSSATSCQPAGNNNVHGATLGKRDSHSTRRPSSNRTKNSDDSENDK